LIKAYKEINAKKKLVIAGGGSHSNKYVYLLKRLAGKNKNIVFPGYVFGKEKEEFLSNCYFFVQPSKVEGSSISLIEAIEHNRPVLAADIPSNKELIKNSSSLFQSNSFTDFCRKFNQFNQRRKTNRITYKFKKDFFSYTWGQLALKFAQVIQSK